MEGWKFWLILIVMLVLLVMAILFACGVLKVTVAEAK